MNSWKMWIGMFLIFLSGVAVGSIGTGYVIREKARQSIGRHVGNMNPGKFLERMTKRLDLTPEQQEQIAGILRRSREEIHAEVGPGMRERMMRTGDEISAVLTPEQRTKFDRMRERIKVRMNSGRMREKFANPGRRFRKERGSEQAKDVLAPMGTELSGQPQGSDKSAPRTP